MAHEDIPPQTTWPEVIINALDRCDLFLPLLTKKFSESLFCQQETGYAYCLEVEILPVYISKAPMGMIADIQAIRFNKKKFEQSCWKIINHVGKNENLSEPVLDNLIEWFGESPSYDDACERAKKILSEFEFSNQQVKKIRRLIKQKSQIHETKHAREYIFNFMDKYDRFFDDEYRDWYDSKRASRMHMKY